MKYVKSFFAFWQDFLIGDAPEIFVGTIVILVLALVIHRMTAISDIGIPVAAIGLLTYSVARGRKD